MLLITLPPGEDGKNVAVVGDPRNVDAHANNPGLFMTMMCPWL